MNMKEMEVLVLQLQQRLELAEGRIQADPAMGEALTKQMNGIADSFRERVAEVHIELTSRLYEDEAVIAQLVERVGEMEPKVNSTNKSAPSKRNMTDEDALKVLTGELKELSHKEAAEKIGLTYAQVYSARLEFTFKHVHKELRDSGWKNPFIKQ